MTSEDIKRRKIPEREMKALRQIAERQAAGDDSHIDYSDIPPLSEEQLASMVRFRGRQARTQISVRIEKRVLDWLKSKGKGHLTLINDILANVMEAEQQTPRR